MSEYKRGTKVVLAEDIPGVPQGTRGKCGRGLGFAVKRYRVRFENGTEAMSVAHDKLVPAKEWPQFVAKRDRELAESAAAVEAAAAKAAAAAQAAALPADAPSTPAVAQVPSEKPPASSSAKSATGTPATGDPATGTQARSAPPSGPERVEVAEFVPGPEVDPDYAPEANRVSELMARLRQRS